MNVNEIRRTNFRKRFYERTFHSNSDAMSSNSFHAEKMSMNNEHQQHTATARFIFMFFFLSGLFFLCHFQAFNHQSHGNIVKQDNESESESESSCICEKNEMKNRKCEIL